jgi:hypothetical protein
VSITKATARSRTLAFMDATGSTRWDTAPNGEVDQAIGYVSDQEWRTILDANPYYNADLKALSTLGGGQIPKSSITTGSSDTAHRLYKVIGMVANNLPVKIVDRFSDYLNVTLTGVQPNLVYNFGTVFQFVPNTDGILVTTYFNYLPVRQDALSGEASIFNFVDGFEDVPLLGAAAYLLASKGGAEAENAVPIVGLAKDRRNDMLSALRSPTLAPPSIRYNDSASEWGV